MNENTRRDQTLGIELRSKTIYAVTANSEGSILSSFESGFDPTSGWESQVVNLAKKAVSESPDIEAIGLALPGLVDVNANKVVDSTRFPELVTMDIAAVVREATGKKVYLENDANAAAFAEMTVGAGKESKDLFYVTVGAGIGGALILDRSLWHGASGYAGEFGYIAVDAEGTRLEDVASAESVVRRAKTRLHQDPASSLFEIGEENITFEDIISAANDEDGLAELILERTGMFLGVAIASVINLLSIEQIVIGGPIMGAGELVLNSIREKASELSFEHCYEAVKIESGTLGEKASSLGAAILAKTRNETA